MKKIFLWATAMIVGFAAMAFCAELVVDTKMYEFNYEIVQTKPAETFVVKKKGQYQNPLVVGFKILPDGSIEPIDEHSRNAQAKPSQSRKTVIAKTHPAPKSVPGYDKPYLNNDWLVIEQNNGNFWAVLNGVPAAEATATRSIKNQADLAGVPPIRENENNNKIGPFTVYFEFNSSQISSKDKSWLNSLTIIYPKASFEVTGYTCSKGTLKRNTELATERARNVAQVLIAQGATVQESAKPMCCYISETELWENRRVEIFVKYVGCEKERG